ncbi:MFS transporter [Akkermansia muciniphila]|uniref:MFS transporter n=1 Tax=Akkermansia muciniphila TaxID=239935 RepID=A0A2N8HBT3_9BACT|nr:MFS transporter [Akkermansia muciniphila]PNC04355.1 MFS transporter [Akkermansia muciniphila]PNC17307.1 MFS transporter [Akkermansia muciniphila]PNC22860.1 MFS transporter [Akkermansia muciniphila]PNC38839.1 MFS transporter [Akkermansia muciniphila]
MLQEQPRQDSFRWMILFMLFAATTINYLDRQILSILKPILDQELGWTDAQYGMIMSIFQASYAVGLTMFGWIIDKYGARMGFAISIIWWSVGALSHAFAVGVKSMGLSRVILGLGEGGNFPASIKTVTNWFSSGERVFATTLFNSGANVGALVAPATIPFIAAAWGWQSAFIAAGVLGFIWVIFWLRMPKNPRVKLAEESAALAQAEKEEARASIPWRKLLAYRQSWSLILVRFLTDPIWWFFLFWLPDFFSKHFGYNIKESALPLIVIYALVTVLSILGGTLTKFLANRGWSLNKVRKISMLIFACCVVPVIFVQYFDMWTIVAVLGLAGGAHQAWSASVYTLGSDMFPKSDVASITGLSGMAGQIGSVLFQTAVGLTLSWFAAQGNASHGYDIIFMVCGSAYLAAFVIFTLIIPNIKMVSPREN